MGDKDVTSNLDQIVAQLQDISLRLKRTQDNPDEVIYDPGMYKGWTYRRLAPHGKYPSRTPFYRFSNGTEAFTVPYYHTGDADLDPQRYIDKKLVKKGSSKKGKAKRTYKDNASNRKLGRVGKEY